MSRDEVAQRDERIGRPLAHGLKRAEGLVDRLERDVPRLDAVPGKPAAGGPIEPPGLSVREQCADGRGVGEGDARQFGGGVADQVQVSEGERPAESGVGVTLR